MVYFLTSSEILYLSLACVEYEIVHLIFLYENVPRYFFRYFFVDSDLDNNEIAYIEEGTFEAIDRGRSSRTVYRM